jgi:hypothetical protein
MGIKYWLVAGGEKYVGNDGKERRKDIYCGVIVDNQYGGISVKLESLPVDFDGWLNTRDKKPGSNNKENSDNKNEAAPPANFDDMESDVPF